MFKIKKREPPGSLFFICFMNDKAPLSCGNNGALSFFGKEKDMKVKINIRFFCEEQLQR